MRNCSKKCAEILYKWVGDNFMKANSDKSNLLLSTEEFLVANINGDIISNSKIEKLLDVTIETINLILMSMSLDSVAKRAGNLML